MSPKNPKGPTVEPTMGMAPMDQQEIPIEEGPAIGTAPMQAPPTMGTAPMA